jgi:hypothetical protein
MFGLLGDKARQRSGELAGELSNFYADDQRMVDLFRQMLDLAEKAVREVEDVLGPPGMLNPYNVPLAAATLGTYAQLFREPERELTRLAGLLNDTRTALGAS